MAGSVGHASESALSVSGEVKSPLTLTVAELKNLPTSTITVAEHDGTTAKYDGVFLHDILNRAGVPFGESLRGKDMQLCLLVKAADGYKAAFALAELDPAVTDKKVLLAFRRDGKELDNELGPLRLVIPDEKRHSRWVRRVTELEVIRLTMPPKQ